MHAYLFVEKDKANLEDTINRYSKNLGVKILSYNLSKIAEVKELQNLTKLSFSEPTAILIKDIEKATEEALSAFLKNLEEPQENLYYFLTTSSFYALLPTIISRCQIVRDNIKSVKLNLENEEEIKNFFGFSLGQKLSFLEKIKSREEALKFISGLIFLIHQKITQGKEFKNRDFEAEIVTQTFKNLKANGNVGLQLSNLAIKLEELSRYN